MINILKCNNIDLNTLIEINQNEINNLKNSSNVLPFMIGDIKRLQKENKQLTFLINHLNK
tara:strand:+ start:930 stop:1109 length:180 start_codon:yes stop_codon:yes gene_type:complete